MNRFRKTFQEYIAEFVYGATDGTITTFAVVAAAAGAGLPARIAAVLGLANLFADGFSMGVSSFLSKRSESAQEAKRRRRIRRQLATDKGLMAYLHDHLSASYGLAGKQLDEAVKTALANPAAVREHLERETFGPDAGEDIGKPLKLGLATFLAFILVGFVPLIVYVFTSARDANSTEFFMAACILTGLTFAAIGLIKGIVTQSSRLRSIAETVLLGGTAAAISYIVGAWFDGIL